MNKRVIFTGICPESGKRQQIAVTFIDAFGGGSIPSDFKKDAYYCAYASEHGCAARGDRALDCPIYKAARL